MKQLLFTLLLSSFLLPLSAQRDWSKIEIKTEQVAENIYVLFGSGGNIGIAVGEDGVYMIDDQFAPLSEKILAAVTKITDKPLRYLVNTHWHGDHTGGNENMAKAGAVIVAHENVYKRMSTKQFRGMGRIVEASPYTALPQITFTEDMKLHLDSTTSMHIMHFHNAHTDGDAYIYFPEQNVLHMGENFFAGRYPYIDLNSGGSIDGLVDPGTLVQVSGLVPVIKNVRFLENPVEWTGIDTVKKSKKSKDSGHQTGKNVQNDTVSTMNK